MNEALMPITFEQFLQDLGEGGVENSPGPSGLGYALLRCLPMGAQKLLWRMRNLIVRGQKFPSLQLDLIIVAIPKSNTLMQGYVAVRPISLYEAFSKICTGSVQPLHILTVLGDVSLLDDHHVEELSECAHDHAVNSIGMGFLLDRGIDMHSLFQSERIGERYAFAAVSIVEEMPRARSRILLGSHNLLR